MSLPLDANRRHGTPATYKDGCRCLDCRGASAAYRADLRERQAREAEQARRAALRAAGITDNPDWMSAAACNDPAMTPRERARIFFPAVLEDKHGYTPLAEAYVEAKAICARCPVRSQCLDRAIATSERYGVWGGLDPAERRTERRRRAARVGAANRKARAS